MSENGYYCDVCAAPASDELGPCPGCGNMFCEDHHDPENHGPLDPTTVGRGVAPKIGCEGWNFSIDNYGPKER